MGAWILQTCTVMCEAWTQDTQHAHCCMQARLNIRERCPESIVQLGDAWLLKKVAAEAGHHRTHLNTNSNVAPGKLSRLSAGRLHTAVTMAGRNILAAVAAVGH